MTHRPRPSELLLRLVVRDPDSYQGLLGDLHEEAARCAQPPGRFEYDRAVLRLARSYLADRLRGWRVSRVPAGADERGGWLLGVLADFRLAARLLWRRPSNGRLHRGILD